MKFKDARIGKVSSMATYNSAFSKKKKTYNSAIFKSDRFGQADKTEHMEFMSMDMRL